MPGESESTTRKKRIDQALARDDWRVVLYGRWLAGDRTAADAVAEFPTDSGPADYLLHLDGQPVADVEAKKISVDPRNVIEQAKRYSRSLDGGSRRYGPEGYGIPFLYSTNGELIYTCDLRDTLLAAR